MGGASDAYGSHPYRLPACVRFDPARGRDVERAGRALSTRQGVHRRRLVQIFLGLALACFVVVTTLKFASPVARAEVGRTLSGNTGSTANGHETRSTAEGYVANGDEAILKKQEIPSR